MSADDQNTQLLHAMIQIFQPSRADCERMAKIMDNGVTANALRQRIAKLRNKLNANNGGGGGGSVASTPASTTKRGGRNKKAAANPELDYDGNGDSGSAAVTPSKNSRARGASGGGRKRVTYDDDNDDGIAAENEAEELKAAATKKTKTTTAAAAGKKAKQKEAAVVKQEEELDIEHEVVAGDGGDVGVVAANAILDDVALSALEDGEAEQLIDQGSFFYLQDEDEAV